MSNSSRDKILTAVKNNQPAAENPPEPSTAAGIRYDDKPGQFANTLKAIGGTVIEITSIKEIADYVLYSFSHPENFVTTITALDQVQMLDEKLDPHTLENIEVAILKAQFAVAENGAVWLTERETKIRALPFICQHLAVLLDKKDIVNNMHEAYQLIGSDAYEFGVFIAGPSKTADIEQSLVLGAHGPKTMTVFVLA